MDLTAVFKSSIFSQIHIFFSFSVYFSLPLFHQSSSVWIFHPYKASAVWRVLTFTVSHTCLRLCFLTCLLLLASQWKSVPCLWAHLYIFHWWQHERMEKSKGGCQGEFIGLAFVLPDVKLTQCHTQAAGRCLSAIRSRWRWWRRPDVTHTIIINLSLTQSHTKPHSHTRKTHSNR